MSTDDPASRGFSLKRWSQRKLGAARAAAASIAAPPAPETFAPPTPAVPATPDAGAGAAAEAPLLPPIESLTIDSDFSAFLGPEIDPGVKLAALKKLLRDPRFNVMDGLDVYIDDYSIPDPIAPELVRQLAHARYLFDPPRTRVNEAGFVEDVPADEVATEAQAAGPMSASDTEALPPPSGVPAAPAAAPGAPVAVPAAPAAAPAVLVDAAAEVASPREGSEPRR